MGIFNIFHRKKSEMELQPESEISKLRILISIKQKEYGNLFRFHKLVSPFYDHDGDIKMTRYLYLMIFAISLFALANYFDFGQSVNLFIKIILVISATYTLFIYWLSYKHKSVFSDLNSLNYYLSEIEFHEKKNVDDNTQKGLTKEKKSKKEAKDVADTRSKKKV